MGFHWYWDNGVSLTAEKMPVRQAHFKANCKWLSVQNNRTDSEDSSCVLTDIHTSYSRALKPAALSVPIALLFSCIPEFLPKFSRLSHHPYFSIPHFLSYALVLSFLSQWWLWRISSSGTFRHYALFWARWIHSTFAILFVWYKVQHCLPLYAQIFKEITALSVF